MLITRSNILLMKSIQSSKLSNSNWTSKVQMATILTSSHKYLQLTIMWFLHPRCLVVASAWTHIRIFMDRWAPRIQARVRLHIKSTVSKLRAQTSIQLLSRSSSGVIFSTMNRSGNSVGKMTVLPQDPSLILSWSHSTKSFHQPSAMRRRNFYRSSRNLVCNYTKKTMDWTSSPSWSLCWANFSETSAASSIQWRKISGVLIKALSAKFRPTTVTLLTTRHRPIS